MQNPSEISILDWLREKFSNPRKLLRELWAKRKPEQAAASISDKTTNILAADGLDATPVSNTIAQTAQKLEDALESVTESVQTIATESGIARVVINVDIPHGTKLTITIQADSQGQVSIEKQTKNIRPVLHNLKTQQSIQIPLRERIRALKNGLAPIGGLLSRLTASVTKVAILGNGFVLIILALVTAFIADGQLRQAAAFTDAALFPLTLTGVFFAWGTWAIHKRQASLLNDAPSMQVLGFLAEKRERNITVGLIGMALVLTFGVTQSSIAGGPVNAAWLLSLWILAILMVCVAAWRVQGKNTSDHNNKWLLLAVIAIVLLAFVLRVWQLGSIPYVLGGDEGEQGVEILDVLNNNIVNPFTTGWYGVPTLSFFFNAPTVALFGNTIFGIRLMWVLVGTASVLVTYLLTKELKGTRIALISATLVATYHYHIHFSRLGSNQISDTLLVGLSLLFLVRGYLRGKWLDWTLAGVFVGLGQYFYAGGRLAVVLAIFLLIYLWVRDGFNISHINRVGVGFFLVALLVSGGPMFGYAINSPNQYNTRANQIGILQNGWLVNEANILEKSQGEVLLDQFWRASLAFNAYPDRTAWYGLEGPLLDQLAGVLFIPALISATLWSIRDRRLAPMVAWWWAAILTGGMLTDTTPSSQRLITASIPTMFFVAWAIEHFVTAIMQQFSKPFGLAAGILATLVLSLFSINLYFNDYTPQKIFGGEHAMIGTMIAEHVHEVLGEDTQIYFFGAPHMYGNIGTMRYLLPNISKIDIDAPLNSPFKPDSPPQAQTLLFVFVYERVEELEWVKKTYPDGDLRHVPNPINPDTTLYTTYTVKQVGSP